LRPRREDSRGVPLIVQVVNAPRAHACAASTSRTWPNTNSGTERGGATRIGSATFLLIIPPCRVNHYRVCPAPNSSTQSARLADVRLRSATKRFDRPLDGDPAPINKAHTSHGSISLLISHLNNTPPSPSRRFRSRSLGPREANDSPGPADLVLLCESCRGRRPTEDDERLPTPLKERHVRLECVNRADPSDERSPR